MLQCAAAFGICSLSSPILSIIGLGISASSLTFLWCTRRDQKTPNKGILPLYHQSSSKDKDLASRKSTAKLLLTIGLLISSPSIRRVFLSQFLDSRIDGVSSPIPLMECSQIRHASSGDETIASVSCASDYPHMTGCFGYTPNRNHYHGDIAVRTSSTICSAFAALPGHYGLNATDTSVWVSAQCCRLRYPQGSSEVSFKTKIVRSSQSVVSCPSGSTLLGCSARGNYAVHGTDYVQNKCEVKGFNSNDIMTETSAVCGSISSPKVKHNMQPVAISCLTINGIRSRPDQSVEASCPIGYSMSDCSAWDRSPIRGAITYSKHRGHVNRNQSSQICVGHGTNESAQVRVSARCCHVIPVDEFDM